MSNAPRWLCFLAGAALATAGSAWFARTDSPELSEPTASAAPVPAPVVAPVAPVAAAAPADGKLRIIAFGAHPDDCELRVGGTAAKWAALGHHVKLVSLTNGDIGHWGMAGGPLAIRRKAEVEVSGKILGISPEIVDIHDGELLPTLETRKIVTKLIREWKADIVLSHRPNDYHPDHRNVGVVVQDAAFMVTVPFFCPDIPYLTANPVFLYYEDRFEKPTPFQADIAVAIDDTVDKKLRAVESLQSQFLEGGCNGSAALYPPNDDAQRRLRFTQVHDAFVARFSAPATKFRKSLEARYGPDRAATVKSAEVFEICEYGRRPTPAELKTLFPF